jgi:SPP1 gp7 family putative phage head morphogenesis protein
MTVDVQLILEEVNGRHARPVTQTLKDMMIAVAFGRRAQLADIRARLIELSRETMGVAEIVGATEALKIAAKMLPEEKALLRRHSDALLNFADTATQTVLPRVTFAEALEDMVERTPITIRNAAERTAARISKLYSEGRVVAFARSAEQAVTQRAQDLIAKAIGEGIPELDFASGGVVKPGVGTQLSEAVKEVATRTDAWSESYSRMAFRTNLNTAVTAGKFRMVQDPVIKEVVPAFMYDAVGDGDTRKNHRALDNMLLSVDNPEWKRLAPPNGYSCRCTLRLVGLPELRRRGLIDEDGEVIESAIPAGGGPDEGFRKGDRPDLFIP